MDDAFLVYFVADEVELNSALEGRLDGPYAHFESHGFRSKPSPGKYGVIAKLDNNGDRNIQPLVLFINDQDQRRLFARLATLRPELSPISSWCHLLEGAYVDSVDSIDRNPDFSDLQASWTGLAVAEAAMLAERSADRLSLTSCLATQSFTVGRTASLWPNRQLAEIVERYDRLHSLIRGGFGGAARLRPSLEPIWAVLVGLMGNTKLVSSRNLEEVQEAAQAIISARRFRLSDEAIAVARALFGIPEAEILYGIEQVNAEQRVNAFDHIVAELRASKIGARYHSLSFLAAYLSTIAAGGKSSINLVEKLSKEFPQLLAWAYVISGLGQKLTWTSAFDGLGRLVARELSRPLRFADGPLCDFSVEEAGMLYDRQLNDPLVHLRIKQTRAVTVAIYPGVNIAVPLGDVVEAQKPTSATPNHQVERQQSAGRERSQQDLFAALADIFYPHIEGRINRSIEEAIAREAAKDTKSRSRAGSARAASQRKQL